MSAIQDPADSDNQGTSIKSVVKAVSILEASVRFQRDNRYVSLGRQFGDQVVYLRGRSPEMLQRDLNTVSVAPMHATAPGKVFAARKTREQVVSEFSGYSMDPYTPQTITTIEGFLDEIAKVRRQGFALDDRELVADLRHVATPIFDHLGQVAATLSIGGPAQDMQGTELDSLTEAIGHGALEVSRQLGFSATYPVIATPSAVLTPLAHNETPQAAE